jgi:hypothetical protein
MSQSILSSIVSKISFYAVNELTGHPVWTNLKIIDVDIEGSSENTDDPISETQYVDGTTHSAIRMADLKAVKVQSPTKITVHAICPDISTIESVLSTFNDTQSTVSVTTKGVNTKTMSVVSVDIKQDSDALSVSLITIILERTMPAPITSGYNPSQASDSTSIGSRLQHLATNLTSTVGKLYNTVSSAASSALSSIKLP